MTTMLATCRYCDCIVDDDAYREGRFYYCDDCYEYHLERSQEIPEEQPQADNPNDYRFAFADHFPYGE